MAEDLDAASFDSNAWYQISEARVDTKNSTPFTSELQRTSAQGALAVGPANSHYWQLHRVSSSNSSLYSLRTKDAGISQQLAVCRNNNEINDSKTQACMLPSNAGDAQIWDVRDWGNGTFRFVNQNNGTGYVLDVHPGNPIFLNDDTDMDTYQPAQHWMVNSVSEINDGAFSTTFTSSTTSSTPTPATTTSSSPSSSPSSSSSSSSSGLSTGAKAGIGVGVSFAALLLISLGIFLFMRRRKNRRKEHHELPSQGTSPGNEYAQVVAPGVGNGQRNAYEKDSTPSSRAVQSASARAYSAGGHNKGEDGPVYGAPGEDGACEVSAEAGPSELDSNAVPRRP